MRNGRKPRQHIADTDEFERLTPTSEASVEAQAEEQGTSESSAEDLDVIQLSLEVFGDEEEAEVRATTELAEPVESKPVPGPEPTIDSIESSAEQRKEERSGTPIASRRKARANEPAEVGGSPALPDSPTPSDFAASSEEAPPDEASPDEPAPEVTAPDEAAPDAAAGPFEDLADVPEGPKPYQPPAPQPADDPALARRLARIHLRSGSLAIARAELEALAGGARLGPDGLLDLAESRWRMGELHGAGEAAVAYLEADGKEPLGFVIAAEAAALAGKHEQSRKLVEAALEASLSGLDDMFAGIRPKASWGTALGQHASAALTGPASVAWPVIPAASVATTSDAEPAALPAPAQPPKPEMAGPLEIPAPPVTPAPVAPASVMPVEPIDATAPVVDAPGAVASSLPEASSEVEPQAWQTELAAGCAALAGEDALLAALHFAVALRSSNQAARSILEAIDRRSDLALELVRGDALKALGQTEDAGNAYRSVASAPGSGDAAHGADVNEPRPESSAPVEPERSEPHKIDWSD